MRKCSFLTHSKYSDYAHERSTDCRQIADENYFIFGRGWTQDATINEVTPLNRTELCESVVFLHSQIILTLLMNDSQTADELPTNIISSVGEAGHRRNHK